MFSSLRACNLILVRLQLERSPESVTLLDAVNFNNIIIIVTFEYEIKILQIIVLEHHQIMFFALISIILNTI